MKKENWPKKVKIVEVAPRDGLQNEKNTIDIDDRYALIEKLVAAGCKTIEAGAFVSPKWVPQMAQSDQLLKKLIQNKNFKTNKVSFPVLVPNERGMQDAIRAGATEIAVFTAASDAFNKKNTNATIDESFENFKSVFAAAAQHNIKVRGYISCVVACPYSGKIDPDDVLPVVQKLLAMGCYEVSLGDTTGVATPADIEALLSVLTAHIDQSKLALHCHDTYGQALGNIMVGLDYGISTFDSSVAGLGGCPYAAGASGNVASEDLVYMLHGLNIETGIDLEKLAEAGDFITKKAKIKNRSKAGQAILALKK